MTFCCMQVLDGDCPEELISGPVSLYRFGVHPDLAKAVNLRIAECANSRVGALMPCMLSQYGVGKRLATAASLRGFHASNLSDTVVGRNKFRVNSLTAAENLGRAFVEELVKSKKKDGKKDGKDDDESDRDELSDVAGADPDAMVDLARLQRMFSSLCGATLDHSSVGDMPSRSSSKHCAKKAHSDVSSHSSDSGAVQDDMGTESESDASALAHGLELEDEDEQVVSSLAVLGSVPAPVVVSGHRRLRGKQSRPSMVDLGLVLAPVAAAAGPAVPANKWDYIYFPSEVGSHGTSSIRMSLNANAYVDLRAHCGRCGMRLNRTCRRPEKLTSGNRGQGRLVVFLGLFLSLDCAGDGEAHKKLLNKQVPDVAMREHGRAWLKSFPDVDHIFEAERDFNPLLDLLSGEPRVCPQCMFRRVVPMLSDMLLALSDRQHF